jgi:hypothetical protein
MKIEINSFPDHTNWVNGNIQFNGRISKLTIKNSFKNIIINYDRNWDIMPHNNNQELILTELVDYLESTTKRFN